jgi:hypothetical protein
MAPARILIERCREGKGIAGHGAPGKGNPLMNFCGIRTDLLEYTVNRNPYKHGQFLPATHIPIKHLEVHPDPSSESRRDFRTARPRA